MNRPSATGQSQVIHEHTYSLQGRSRSGPQGREVAIAVYSARSSTRRGSGRRSASVAMEWWWISSASAWNRSFDRGTGIDYYEPRLASTTRPVGSGSTPTDGWQTVARTILDSLARWTPWMLDAAPWETQLRLLSLGVLPKVFERDMIRTVLDDKELLSANFATDAHPTPRASRAS